MTPMTDTAILAQVRHDAAGQHALATSTRFPLERLAVATVLAKPPEGLDDPLWADLPTAGKFFHESLDEGFESATRAVVARDSRALYIRFECDGAPARPNVHSQYYLADNVEVFLDPAHDHYHYLQLAIAADGTCVGSRRTRPIDSQRWENKGKADETPLAADAWRGEARISKSGWSALFTIPLATLGLDAHYAGPIGFNLGHQRRGAATEYTQWNQTYFGAHAPWAFGQLYLGEAPSIAVDQVDLGDVRLWENRGELVLRNRVERNVELTLNVSVRGAVGASETRPFYSSSTPLKLHASSDAARVPIAFPFNPDDYRWNNLHLELTSAKGETVWRADYLFGRGWPGWLLPIDDRREGPDVPNPSPDDPEFMANKRRYIIRRLPRFVRKTTAQGAPSDFTLEAADGSVRFDLMQAGALQRIADYIYARYDNDVDRLLGATFFVHQPAVITYVNKTSDIVSALNPLSVLRFGGAQCCCSAAALLGLIEKMKCDDTGRPYRGTRVSIPGHVTTVIEYRGKRVHLDPSVGRFYFLRDNVTLASMEELLADPTLAGRAGLHLEEFHRKAAQCPDAPHFYRPDHGVWPNGAPAE